MSEKSTLRQSSIAQREASSQVARRDMVADPKVVIESIACEFCEEVLELTVCITDTPYTPLQDVRQMGARCEDITVHCPCSNTNAESRQSCGGTPIELPFSDKGLITFYRGNEAVYVHNSEVSEANDFSLQEDIFLQPIDPNLECDLSISFRVDTNAIRLTQYYIRTIALATVQYIQGILFLLFRRPRSISRK